MEDKGLREARRPRPLGKVKLHATEGRRKKRGEDTGLFFVFFPFQPSVFFRHSISITLDRVTRARARKALVRDRHPMNRVRSPGRHFR